MDSNEFWKFVDGLREQHGLVRAKMEQSVVVPAPRGTPPVTFFVSTPRSDADMVSGTDKGSAPTLYETVDLDGGIAYEIYFSEMFRDMLCRPELVERGWKNRSIRNGDTPESARAWLARFRGCQDTDYFAWLAGQHQAETSTGFCG